MENLKASKMKELVLKKRNDMEELCRKAHIIPDSYIALDNSIESMESGEDDLFCLFHCDTSFYLG